MITRFKKAVASAVTAALILTTPGLGTYQVLAANFTAGAVKAVSVVPGGTGAAGLGVVGSGAVNGRSVLAPINVSLTGSLSGVNTLVPQVGAQLNALEPTLGAVEGVAAEEFNLNHAVAGPTGGGHGKTAQDTGKSKGHSPVPGWAKPGAAFAKSLQADFGKMSVGNAHSAGTRIMDKILSRRTHSSDGAIGPMGKRSLLNNEARGLKASALNHSAQFDAGPPAVAPQPAPRQKGNKFLGFIKSVATMAVGAGAVFGIHTAAIALLPTVFATLPIAAVWAVSSGVFILPIALYSRYRLSLRDSSRLKGIKVFNDLAIGAFLGAVAVAAPVFFSGAVLQGLSAVVPAILGLTYAASATSQNSDGVVGGWINWALTWASLNLLTPLIGVAASAVPISLGSVFGLMAIPALTTIAFFLGRLIMAAESGRPFSVPGSMQKIRFPSYTWVMTGVVFALLTGYSPVWTNAAFAAWMFLGSKKWFNFAYFGILGWSIATGFAAPVTFLAIAFLPERASMWTENLLEKMLPAGKPAPSSASSKVSDNYIDKPERWPKFRFWLKTGLIVAALGTFGFVMGSTVFGFASLLKNLGIAAALSVLPLVFSKWLIKKTMRAEPMKEEEDPETYGIMRELRERINAGRAEKGQKPIPMPEMVNVPMQVPNAFATGINPFHAMVGVTYEMKDMTLNPQRTREGLIRLLYSVEPQSKSFHVFRKAIRGSIPGISQDAGPQEVIGVLQDADAVQLKALGVRALRGVMGHEFNHVMHYDMALGAITGSLASAISFASYGVLWAAGHAEAFLKGLLQRITGSDKEQSKATLRGKPPVRVQGEGPKMSTPEATPGPIKPEIVEPVSTTAGIVVLLGLAKIFTALWAPVIAKLLQMASGRTREGHADEGGAMLTEDPESLALGLGLLTSWRPVSMFTFDRALLPRLAAQANVMTVNPLQQLREAGALPGQSAQAAAGRAVSKSDDWFFQLFLTHPDTTQRIERLHDMAAAMEAGGPLGVLSHRP